MKVNVMCRKFEYRKDIHYKTQTGTSCEKCNSKAFRLAIEKDKNWNHWKSGKQLRYTRLLPWFWRSSYYHAWPLRRNSEWHHHLWQRCSLLSWSRSQDDPSNRLHFCSLIVSCIKTGRFFYFLNFSLYSHDSCSFRMMNIDKYIISWFLTNNTIYIVCKVL